MTDSDRHMDQRLGEFPSLEPARSVWPEVEKHLIGQERKLRRRSILRYSMSALAASLILAVAVYSNLGQQPEQDLSIQKTVQNAVENARPRVTFSNLEIRRGQNGLEALLVSAKPRRAEAAYAVETLSKQDLEEAADSQNLKEINEF